MMRAFVSALIALTVSAAQAPNIEQPAPVEEIRLAEEAPPPIIETLAPSSPAIVAAAPELGAIEADLIKPAIPRAEVAVFASAVRAPRPTLTPWPVRC